MRISHNAAMKIGDTWACGIPLWHSPRLFFEFMSRGLLDDEGVMAEKGSPTVSGEMLKGRGKRELLKYVPRIIMTTVRKDVPAHWPKPLSGQLAGKWVLGNGSQSLVQTL